MKKLAIATVFTLLAGTAYAQGEVMNRIGVYVDPDGLQNCSWGAGNMTLYLVGTGLRTATVGGWEAKIIVDGPTFGPLNPVYPVDGLNLARKENEWVVGFGQPAPAEAGNCVLMTFDVFVNDDTVPTEFFIEPVYFASIEGSCAYLDGADYNIILPLWSAPPPPGEGEDGPVFILNKGCPVPNEEVSWGAVKSLYR